MIGLYNMSNNGLRAFSGVTVGILGSVIGIHSSLLDDPRAVRLLYPNRIGDGPWQNAKGVVVATSVADLHSANAKLGKSTSLTEKQSCNSTTWMSRGSTPAFS